MSKQGLLHSIEQDIKTKVLDVLKAKAWDGHSCLSEQKPLRDKKNTSHTCNDDNETCSHHPLVEAVRCQSHAVLQAILDKYYHVCPPTNDVTPNVIAFCPALQQTTSPVHMACHMKDATALRFLLEAGADPNLTATSSSSLLTKACDDPTRLAPLLTLTDTSPESLACRRILLEYGANPNAMFYHGHTLLHWDCLRPSLSGAAMLLDFGAHAHHKPTHGTVPSHIAYWSRNLELGQLLKQNGATFGAFYERELYQTVEAYLESGDAHLEECPYDGLGLLHVCAFSVSWVEQETANHLVQVAVQSGANLNLPCQRERSPTPLMIASGVGNTPLSLAILRYCPHTDPAHAAMDDQGCTSIFYAVGSLVNTRRIMQQLVAVGANLNAKSKFLSRTALHEGALFFYTVPTNLQSLIDLGAHLNVTDTKGWTALHYSCLPALEGNLSSTRVLLQAGALINAVDYQGRTPLHFATRNICREERRGMVRLPTERYGPTTSSGPGKFPMLDLVKLLLDHGADSVAVDHDGNLPMFHLCHAPSTDHDNDDDVLVALAHLATLWVLVQAAAHEGLFDWCDYCNHVESGSVVLQNAYYV